MSEIDTINVGILRELLSDAPDETPVYVTETPNAIEKRVVAMYAITLPDGTKVNVLKCEPVIDGQPRKTE